MSTSKALVSQPTDFSFLNADEFQAQYSSKDGTSTICFFVPGIRCEKCVRKLEALTGTVPGLLRVRVEMGRNLVHAEVDNSRLPLSQVAELIEGQGFNPVPLAQEREAELLERNEERRELIRLAVAGACAGNIMTFAFAVYSGADPVFFLWLSFFLYLPVVSYVALPFYKEAIASLRGRRLSIDLPMAVASFAGFAFSTVQLLRGRPDGIYFDSLAGFLFLILAARAVQRRMQRRLLAAGQPPALADRVRVGLGNTWAWRLIQNVRPGDQIVLRQSEMLPGDARLNSNRARFSLAWLSGESAPAIYLRGSIVPAGARLEDTEASLEIKKTLPETEFGKILETVRKFSLSRSRAVIVSDRWAQILLVTVFTLALAYLAFHWSVSPEEAISRSLALIVLACPCAMAFGTPLALAASLKNARNAGLIIRDTGILEAAYGVKTIFLDKTGTLTETDLTLKRTKKPVSIFHKSIILGLENQSSHPIAFAFRKAFSEDLLPVEMTGLKEIAGAGVSGYFDGSYFELRADLSPCETSCVLLENGQEIEKFTFAPALTPDCEKVLKDLRSEGYKLIMLSGDGRLPAMNTGLHLGFAADEIYAGLSPSEKAAIVAATPKSLMVGDGINDSLALMNARASVAVSGGVEAALKCSGAYLTRPGLAGISALMRESRSAVKLIRRNLGFSAAYNLIGGTLALCGYVNPLVAAILMPVSSGLILFITWFGSRR